MSKYTITVSYNGKDLHIRHVDSLEEASMAIEVLKAEYGDCIYKISLTTPA